MQRKFQKARLLFLKSYTSIIQNNIKHNEKNIIKNFFVGTL